MGYVEPRHKTRFIERMWTLGEAVNESRYIEIDCCRTKDKDSFPTIYRIDRIKGLKVLEERFHIPYSSRFGEGEFRKRIQFMYGGKLRKATFRYTGTDKEAVLDRLPTAKIIDEDKGAYIVSAEVFGMGIDMWFRSQGSYVEIIEWEEDGYAVYYIFCSFSVGFMENICFWDESRLGGIAKIFCTVLLFPVFLVGRVCVGLLYLAIPILVIIGVVVLIGEAVKA